MSTESSCSKSANDLRPARVKGGSQSVSTDRSLNVSTEEKEVDAVEMSVDMLSGESS